MSLDPSDKAHRGFCGRCVWAQGRLAQCILVRRRVFCSTMPEQPSSSSGSGPTAHTDIPLPSVPGQTGPQAASSVSLVEFQLSIDARRRNGRCRPLSYTQRPFNLFAGGIGIVLTQSLRHWRWISGESAPLLRQCNATASVKGKAMDALMP